MGQQTFFHPLDEVRRAGVQVIVSQEVTMMGEQIRAMDMNNGESLTLAVSVALSVDERAKRSGSDGGRGEPGVAARGGEVGGEEGISGAV